jgi:protein-disulfide isomerase
MEEHTHKHEEKHEHHGKKKSETISVNKTDMWKAGTFLFAILFIVSLMTSGFTGNISNDNVPIQEKQPVAAPTQNPPSPSRVMVEIGDDAVLGDPDAPVTIIEFSDYECPFCGRHFDQTYDQIKTEYVDTGKVKIVFKDFPLSFHENAQKAAEAAECAGEQGKYYEMHDKLFENQNALDVASLKTYAKEIGLKTADFNTCLDSGAMADEVQKDFSDGQAAGVTGTPGFFINGVKLTGAQPYSAFKAAIDAEL